MTTGILLMIVGGAWFAWTWVRTPAKPKPWEPDPYAGMFWGFQIFFLGLLFVMAAS